MLTRVFLTRFLTIGEHKPPTPIRHLLRAYKTSILKGMRFSFDEFNTLCHESNAYSSGSFEETDSLGLNERQRRQIMEKVTRSLIMQMGGEVVPDGLRFSAEYWVYYRRLEKHDFPPDQQPMTVPPKYKRVHWLFITESYFSYGKPDLEKFTLCFD